jgi:hypothetical protein
MATRPEMDGGLMGRRWVDALVSYSATAYMMRREVVCSSDSSVHTMDSGIVPSTVDVQNQSLLVMYLQYRGEASAFCLKLSDFLPPRWSCYRSHVLGKVKWDLCISTASSSTLP